VTSINLGQATATGGDGVYTFSHDAPAEGFPLGAAMVTWTVTDGAGQMAKDTQSVMVGDTTAPSIKLPPDVQWTATGEFTIVGIGTARATDLVDPFPSLTNDRPMNGFPLGTTAVTWTSRDESGNVATGKQMIIVIPPNANPGQLGLTPPDAITNEATGPTTIVSLGNAMASGGTPPITITNDAPAGGFPLGATSVTWTAVDANAASVSGTQVVTITDTTAPSITAPADVAANQDAAGGNTMVDLGLSTFSDIADPNPMVSNNAPANGFAVGTTTVVWTATDVSGNSASDTQQITINDSSFTVTPPAPVTAEATGPRTMVTLGDATANGGVPLVTISNNAPANGFPVGVTSVTWTATDLTSATAIATQTVTIRDTRAPSLTAPADITASQNASGGNTVVNLGTPTLSDIVDPNPTVRNNAPANGFPVGTTTVVWTATDASGNSSTDTQIVSISGGAGEQCSALMSDWVGSVFPMMDSDTTCGGACHVTVTPLQTANGWGFPDSATDEQNLEVFRTIARINFQNESLVTAKARGFTQHGGGAVLQEGTPNYTLLSGFVARARACTTEPPPPSGTAKVIRGSGYEQLSKLTFAVAGRPPTSDEANVVAAAGSDQAAIDNMLVGVLDGLMDEEAFYLRVQEIYNDLLLTNLEADATDNPGSNFDLGSFANAGYFANRSSEARRGANYGISRAPLALIRYVVENDRPFTEIVSANYAMVNPYSAVIYGVNPGGPNYPYSSDNSTASHSIDDWRRVNSITQTAGDRAVLPLAGVISTHAFLDRYKTTPSNINRKRASKVFDYFLGVDIEALAARDQLNLDAVVGDVPTYEDPQCTVCHDVMDPVAGLFTKRDDSGEYDVDNGYVHTRLLRGTPLMVPAGYGDTRNNAAAELPANQEPGPLVWLGNRLATDDRFAQKTVRNVFTGFTGNTETSPNVTALIDATKSAFVASGFDFKEIVRDVLLSDYFLAQNLDSGEDPNSYRSIGTGRLLTPEELHRRVTAVTGGGYAWRGPNSNGGLLSSHNLLYGGIDSDELTTRTTSPNTLIVGIQDRIANQVSCERVAADLYNGGTLFPLVDETVTPNNGGAAAIRANLQFLHRHLLGEDLATDAPEIDASYQLFLDVRTIGSTAIPTQCRGGGGASDSNGTILPWMAVVTYLLSDYRFFYN
jgi:hypothetical protein